VDIVDVDLLFQSPPIDARIIKGKGKEVSSRASTMEVYFYAQGPLKCLGEKDPFYSCQRKLAV
jgi:hypothetical protein